MLFLVADSSCHGDLEDPSWRILQDFQTGRMGPISLQLAPETDAGGQLTVPIGFNMAAISEQKEEWA
jgi:hypothetical protein